MSIPEFIVGMLVVLQAEFVKKKKKKKKKNVLILVFDGLWESLR